MIDKPRWRSSISLMSTGVSDEAHGASGPTLAQFVAAIPPHCRTPSTLRGLACLGAGLLEVALASAFAYITYIDEMYILWPVSWFIGSIAFASWFVLGHDCGHFSLVRSKGLQVVVGHGLLAPLLYPFYAWKFSHEAHHRFTNRLWRGGDIAFDNAWMPLTVEQYQTERRRAPPLALLYQGSLRRSLSGPTGGCRRRCPRPRPGGS